MRALNSETRIDRLQTLLERFAHLGIGADIAALTLIDCGACTTSCAVLPVMSDGSTI